MDFYDSNGNAPFHYVASLNAIANPTNVVTASAAAASTATGAAASGSSGATSTGTSSLQTAQVSTSKLGGAGRIAAAGSGVWLGVVGLTLSALGGISVLAL